MLVAMGCGIPKVASPTDRRVLIDGPAIVGFFPDVTESDLEADRGIASAFEHWEMALESVHGCFAVKGVRVLGVVANNITIEGGASLIHVAPRFGANPDIGYYLVAPGRQPELVTATVGPSSLLYFLPRAASVYFSLPECAPEPLEEFD